MNTKRIASFVVVALLLAALPGMTAVLAQGQDPAVPIVITPINEDEPIYVEPAQSAGPVNGDQVLLPPKDTVGTFEPSETAALTANKTESESNNTFSTADVMAVGDIMSGKIKGKGDVDYYRVDVPSRAFLSVLIDIDAQVNGSDLDPVVCLYDESGTELSCNDDAEGYDSLIFHYIFGRYGSKPYYIKVREFNHPNEGGDNYTYKLAVYRPLLVSATTSGNVAGIAFDKADVLAHYDFPGGVERWKMFFDASDVGITTNVVGLAATNHGHDTISLVLQNPQSLLVNGVNQIVTPYDIIGFQPGRYGPNTQGTFWMDYRGANYGLTGVSEKIDALSATWFVSTTGAATFSSGATVRDEDVSNLPYGEREFEGNRVSGLGVEDVIGADEDSTILDSGYHQTYYLTIQGTGRVDGISVNQKDIFSVNMDNYRVIGKVWSGNAHHFSYNIDAFDIAE